MLQLNEYLAIMRNLENEQPPFDEQQIEAAEYFSIFFSKVAGRYCLKLMDSAGDEIARAYWESPEFMQEYMSEYYNVEITDEDLDDEFDMKSLEDVDDDDNVI